MARRSDSAEEDEAPAPEQSLPEGTPVRYVTYGVGEGEDARWGWEGLDYAGQVVRRSEPTFESSDAAEQAAKEQA